MSSLLKIYTASKLHHAEKFKKLRTDWPEFHFTARWPFFHQQVDDSPEEAKKFWIDDLHDVERADVVLCYGEGDDILRGALVEVGMAFALGKRVIVVGDRKCYGTWRYYSLVSIADNLDHARNILNQIALKDR